MVGTPPNELARAAGPLDPNQQILDRPTAAVEAMTTLQRQAGNATAAVAAAAAAREGAPRPTARAAPTLEVVDPVEWSTFRRAFEITVRVNNWDDLRARQELAAAMKKEAARVTFHVNPNAFQQTTERMIAAYDAIFVTRAASEAAKAAFHAAKQIRGETLVAYHSRLRDLFARAYPLHDGEASEILRRQFIMGLQDWRVQDYTTMQHPATYAAALNAAQDRVAGLMTLPSQGRTLDYIGSMGSAGGAGVANLNCYNCDQKGHFKRDCPNPPKTGGRGRGRGRGGRGRGRRGRGGRGGGQHVSAVGGDEEATSNYEEEAEN